MRIKSGDLDTMRAPLDFIGINLYYRTIASAPSAMERLSHPQEWLFPVKMAGGQQGPKTDNGWEVWPQALYDIVTRISRDFNRPPIEITESGCAYNDGPDASGVIRDPRRIHYHRQYLEALAAAMADGADVRGYHAWSLIDNFEWADGFSDRFGLAYVDFKTQERTIKDSGRWYAKVAAENRRGSRHFCCMTSSPFCTFTSPTKSGSFMRSRCSASFFCNAGFTNETGTLRSPTLNSVGSNVAYPSFEARWPETVTQTSFPAIFGKELSVDDVAIEAHLLIFDGWRSTAEIGIGRECPGSGCAHGLSQRGAYFVRGEVNLGFRLSSGWSAGSRGLGILRGRDRITAGRRRSLLGGLFELVQFLPKGRGVSCDGRRSLRLRHRRRLLQHQNNSHQRGHERRNADNAVELDFHEGSNTVSLDGQGPASS